MSRTEQSQGSVEFANCSAKNPDGCVLLNGLLLSPAHKCKAGNRTYDGRVVGTSLKDDRQFNRECDALVYKNIG